VLCALHALPRFGSARNGFQQQKICFRIALLLEENHIFFTLPATPRLAQQHRYEVEFFRHDATALNNL
jgi:hypothetical protein